MATVIAPYSTDHVAAVREFNTRFAAVDSGEFRLPEAPAEPGEGRRTSEEYFLALEGDVVRGGYVLSRQEFSFRGETRRVAHYRSPLSEGVLNRAYAAVGLQMLRTALHAEPLLFALGMGGADQPLPQILKAAGWRLHAVPFYFKVVHPRRFLRELRLLRTTAARRFAAHAARLTGAGWLAIRGIQTLRRRGFGEANGEPVRAFEAWADAVWQRSHYRYAMVAARDSRALNALYPASDGRFTRLRVVKRGEIAGWALLLDTEMRGHKQFGDLRVGTVADCLALPEDAGMIVAAAAEWLSERRVDLIISNQTHAQWGTALEHCGFLRGPSNYIFAVSKQLAGLLEPLDANWSEIHITRGDGDGPIHL
jgi:hypothetical protein